jgi:hypothetical protein
LSFNINEFKKNISIFLNNFIRYIANYESNGHDGGRISAVARSRRVAVLSPALPRARARTELIGRQWRRKEFIRCRGRASRAPLQPTRFYSRERERPLSGSGTGDVAGLERSGLLRA